MTAYPSLFSHPCGETAWAPGQTPGVPLVADPPAPARALPPAPSGCPSLDELAKLVGEGARVRVVFADGSTLCGVARHRPAQGSLPESVVLCTRSRTLALAIRRDPWAARAYISPEVVSVDLFTAAGRTP